MTKLRLFGAVAGASLLASTAAHAVPIDLQFTDTVFDTSTPGVNAGDPITFNIFADNGGANLISQTWNVSDITSVTIQAGAYSATVSGSFVSGTLNDIFSTDASGNLNNLNIDVSGTGSDSLGNFSFTFTLDGVSGDIWFASNFPGPNCVFSISNGFSPTCFFGGFGANDTPTSENHFLNTTISLASTPVVTPLPAALPLFATALGGLGLLGWRRKRKELAAA